MHYLIVAVIALAACGPSGRLVKTAKRAQYKASGQTIYDVAVDVALASYDIAERDETNFTFVTKPQFYNAEGGRQSTGADDTVMVSAGSVRLQLLVEVVPVDDSHVTVKVTPRTVQVVSGSPKPRELAPDDPGLPPWVLGRADALTVAVYERAQRYIASP